MLYYHYVQFVKERAGFSEDHDAEKAIRAVFEVLGQRISLEQAEALAETLPVEIREYIKQNPWARPFGLKEFVAQVGNKEGVDPQTATVHARAVLSVLAEYVPSIELLITVDQIPKDIRRLFLWIEKAA
jgi:uncharacterized protein (DUF2267 family)